MKVWSHLAEHQGEQGQVLVSWMETDRFIPTKGVSHRKWSRVPQVLIRTPACPLSPARWVGVEVRDCLTVAPHFWCVTCFWAEPGCLWGGRGQRCPCGACVPWKLYHTNVLHVPKWNLIFKNVPLYLVWGGDCTGIYICPNSSNCSLKTCASSGI